MGVYLNSSSQYSLYKSELSRPFFVDKSDLLEELFPLVEQGNTHICVIRPRKFGKTVMANMIGAFFSKGSKGEIFENLKISKSRDYRKNLNKHNVIYIDFSKMPLSCQSYTEYIGRIEKRLRRDLLKEYSRIESYPEDSLWDILDSIFEEYDGQKFIFVFDEWDYIFRKKIFSQEDRENYILFLNNLLKDHAYVSLSYMTGVLSIFKNVGARQTHEWLSTTNSIFFYFLSF